MFSALARSRSVPVRTTSPLVRGVYWLLVAAGVALALGYLVLRHVLWPQLDRWRPQIVAELSARLGHPVEIARLDAGFEGLLPRLTLDQVRIRDDDGHEALSVAQVTLVLSPRSLISAEPRLAVLQLDSPRIRIERRAPGWLRVAGVDLDLNAPEDGPGLARLLEQRRILVHDGEIDWRDHLAGQRTVVSAIELGVGSVGRRHRASVVIGPVAGAWQRLHLATEFYRPARSRPTDWTLWAGEVYAGIERADAGLVQQWPLPLPVSALAGLPRAGQADFKAWLRFDHGNAQDGQLKLAAQDLRWRGAPGRDVAHLSDVGLEAQVRRVEGQSAITVTALTLREADGLVLIGDGEQHLRLDAAGRPVRVEGALRGFDSAAAMTLARRLPLPPDTLRALEGWQVSGRVSALSGRWAQAVDAAATDTLAGGHLDAALAFERLSVRHPGRSTPQPAPSAGGAPALGLPWFENLTGTARLAGLGGELKLDSRAAVIAFPGLLAEPVVAFDELQGLARFSVLPGETRRQVKAEFESVRFTNADTAGSVSGQYRSGGKGPGLVDLTGRLERGDGTRIWRYMPMAISQPVRDWVRRAVVSGRVDDVRFVVRGDIWDFPFASAGEGEFLVDARLADATLDYAIGWPRIERGEGRLRLERNGLQVAMRSGQIFDVALGATTATIRDYAEATLRIEGSGDGPAQQMIRFVNESPVATRIDDFVRDTQAQGNAKLQLRLELPLRDFDRLRVAGSVGFQGNELKLDNTIPPFSALTGTLEFSEQGLALRDIAARFLGGPLKVEGETPTPGRFVLRAQGRIDAQGMRSVVDNPLTRRLSGETGYRASLDVWRRAASMTLESDLVGLASSLPLPLQKAAAVAWPLRVTTTAQAPADPGARSLRDHIRVDLRDSIRLVLERERDAASERLLIRRGALAIDAEPVMPATGLALLLNTPELDLDTWIPLVMARDMRDAQQRASSEFAPGFSLLPSAVTAVSPRVVVGGKTLHDVVFGATRVEGFWRANIGAREVNGFFNWREPAPGQRIGTLTARFARLEIPKARTTEIESLLDASPDELPALDVAAEEFVLGERRLGSLSLKATNGGSAALPVWQLDSLQITNPAATFRANGSWAPARAGSPRSSALDFNLDLANAGELLAIYGLRNTVKGGTGSVTGSLRWQGSPLAIDYPSLAGSMRLQLGSGQFLKTEPGLAKLIGVLNLQSLPRRLTLDFRDVFAEGFSFDGIDGDVQIAAGVARTDKFQMRGVQAQVDIRGVASLENETQSLEVVVRPEFNAGLASLAYAAMANPAIGLGTFLVQYVLRRPLQQLLSYEYSISGSWADPQVTERRRGALQPPRAIP